MKNAIEEGKVPDIFHCLKSECFEKKKRFLFWKNTPSEQTEDAFWDAAFALHRKSLREKIGLTSTVCSYFNSFIKNYLRKKKEKHSSDPLLDLPPIGEFEEHYTWMGAEYGEYLDAIRSCIEKLDEKCKIVLESDLFGKFGDIKDEQLAKLIDYGDRRGVSMKAKRCYDDLWICLENNYPGLFPNKLKRPK